VQFLKPIDILAALGGARAAMMMPIDRLARAECRSALSLSSSDKCEKNLATFFKALTNSQMQTSMTPFASEPGGK
jgi:hypothetical protein